ncbi:MAG: hypothetical protein J6N55_01770 [Anaerovibrio sp.]|uniref:hypothetical protein n=1 Tax=Anaerovibrio sp. TaxID=1872532 RepID=UPI001B2EAD1F|nr:hypothetical protein [Anaerovibrio sp.]MBO5346616.1 hypothetical protein [Lachnospiraceae bacterium]MBO6244991.1 hypothetical protein [Anaerovibrio sp.]
MSKWTEFRDSIVDTLKVEEVTEELKEKVTQSILDNVFPAIEDAVNHFISKVREQAPGETGWCRIRDGIVLPLVMEGLVYVAKMVLTKSLTKN